MCTQATYLSQHLADASPPIAQACCVTVVAAFPVPLVTSLVLQLGQRCFSPVVTVWMCPFSTLTFCTATVMHFGQAMPVLSADGVACDAVVLAGLNSLVAPLTWSAACRWTGDHTPTATASAMLAPMIAFKDL